MPHVTTSSSPPPSSVKEKLFVNDGPLQPSEVSLLIPSDPSLPLSQLRERYERDGYLFLKGLIPRPAVLKARNAYFTYLLPTGVLQPDTPPVSGIFDSAKDIAHFPGIGAGAVGGNKHPGAHTADFVDLALKAHGEPFYAEEFCKNKELLDFISKFTGWGESTRGVRRTLLRNNIPGTKAIGVHYDQVFLRAGEATSVTAWVPMGDVAVDGGGLIYLEDGSSLGKQFEEDFTEKAIASGLTGQETISAFNRNMMGTGLLAEGPAEFGRIHGRRWLVTNYEAGDVVLHNPYMIHASTINHDRDHVIRLATDLRFVDTSKPWDERWNKQYELDDGV